MKRAFTDPKRLTTRQFLQALQKVRPRMGDPFLKMLQANYSAAKRTITADQMAHALGYQNYQGACNYGKLAKMLCQELGYPDPKDHIPLFLLVSFTEPPPHWLWTMRPQVAEALEELGWVEETEALMPQTGAESIPKHIVATVSRIIRDTDAARRLKKRFHYRCQICGFQIQVTLGHYYIEVHQIRPLGGGHCGKDEHSNMLVVCPNHHAMFDLWIPRFLNPKRIAIGREEFQLELRHNISADTILYYNDFREKRAA